MVVGTVRGTIARLRQISPAKVDPGGKIRPKEIGEVMREVSELYEFPMELNGKRKNSWTVASLGDYLWQEFIAATQQQSESAQPEKQPETPNPESTECS